MSYAILMHRYWQLSWWCYVFDWVTSFSHWDRQVSQHFMIWTRYAIFIRGIFCIFRIPYKQTDSINQCCMLSLARSNKNPKIDLRENSARATMYCDNTESDPVYGTKPHMIKLVHNFWHANESWVYKVQSIIVWPCADTQTGFRSIRPTNT